MKRALALSIIIVSLVFYVFIQKENNSIHPGKSSSESLKRDLVKRLSNLYGEDLSRSCTNDSQLNLINIEYSYPYSVLCRLSKENPRTREFLNILGKDYKFIKLDSYNIPPIICVEPDYKSRDILYYTDPDFSRGLFKEFYYEKRYDEGSGPVADKFDIIISTTEVCIVFTHSPE